VSVTGEGIGNGSAVQFGPWICPDRKRNGGDGG